MDDKANKNFIACDVKIKNQWTGYQCVRMFIFILDISLCRQYLKHKILFVNKYI